MSDIDQWLEHVHELADAAGVELLPDDIAPLLNASVDRGWDARGIEEAFRAFVNENFEDADDPDDEVFDDDELDHDEDTDAMPDDQGDSVDPRLEQDLAYGIARTEERIGRKLTHAEVEQVGDRIRHELAIGGGPREVAAAFESTAAKPIADMSHAESVAFQVQRLTENRPTLANALEAEGRGLDLDDDADRRAYMQARLEGAEFDNPDPVEPAGDESGFAAGEWS